MDNIEIIIVELLARIKSLEERVNSLEKQAEDKIKIVQTDRSKKDTTKYLYDGVKYGKARLVLKIVQDFVAANPDKSSDELRFFFNASLQGSLGVIRDVWDVTDSYKDYDKRFFMKDIIHTHPDPCVVCSQWGKENISWFVGHAIEMGFDITPLEK